MPTEFYPGVVVRSKRNGCLGIITGPTYPCRFAVEVFPSEGRAMARVNLTDQANMARYYEIVGDLREIVAERGEGQ